MEPIKRRTSELEAQAPPELEKLTVAWMRVLKKLDVKDLATFLKLVANSPDSADDDYHCPLCRNQLTLEQIKALAQGRVTCGTPDDA